jgi:methyl-accepting chemotaxis protein
MVLFSDLFTGLFFNRRLKYKTLVSEAKSIFDNPLMSYIYTGNNDAIGTLNLALKMRSAELKAVVGRVRDVSENITTTAKKSSEWGRRQCIDFFITIKQ